MNKGLIMQRGKRPTLNVQRLMLNVGCWTLDVLFLLGFSSMAQNAPVPAQQPDPLMQLMLSQPPIDVSSKVEAKAAFDPPVLRAGDQATYRVTFTALKDSIVWPEKISAPPELQILPGARGELFSAAGNQLKPMTSFNQRVRALKPGVFTIPQFVVSVYGTPVTVPEARVEVQPASSPSSPSSPSAPRLVVDFLETNVFVGQPVRTRVLMHSTTGTNIQGLSQVKLNGESFMLDNSGARQSITAEVRSGTNVPVYSFETTLIPLTSGAVEVVAQGFTAGNQFGGPIVIQGQVTIPGGVAQPVLLDSDPVVLHVKPLPVVGRRPGFSGFIGNLDMSAVLVTNRIRVGDIARLIVTFRSDQSLARFVPPQPPTVRGWQIFPPSPTNTPALQPPGNSLTYAYSIVAQTNGTLATPQIPFSYFDPQRAAYVDLTIPSVPITVDAPESSVDVAAWLAAETLAAADAGQKPSLSPLATTTGRTASSLVPPQARPGFIALQLLPLVLFSGLWAWDRRRRFLESHPEIVRRRKARRMLRRARREMDAAAAAGDPAAFVNCAVRAVQVACAPHFPAEPEALVCKDALELFDKASQDGRTGDVLRKLFVAADAIRFSTTDATPGGLLDLRAGVEQVLDELEVKL